MSTQDISVVMITIDRSPRENYLVQTMENLERGGVFSSERLDSFNLIVGNNTTGCQGYYLDTVTAVESLPHSLVRISTLTLPLLPCENAGRALLTGSHLASHHPNGWVLFLEDDIDVCADFLGSVGRWLDRHEDPNYLLYQLGCPYIGTGIDVIKPQNSLWTCPSLNAFYGTQAIALRPGHARALGDLLWEGGREKFSTCEYDLMIGDYAASCGYKIAASVPSFVQHIGTQSSLSDRLTCHTFPSWPGREWSYK